MVIVQITTDNREAFKEYSKPEPWFGAAPEALFQGFAEMPDARIHVVSCTQREMSSPEKLAGNIWFHSLHVPKMGWLRTGYQGCIRAVRNKIRELNPDLVHGQGTERECALSSVYSGHPNVVTIHGCMSAMEGLLKSRFASFYWCAARLERFTLKRTGGVFCNSAYTEQLIAPWAKRTWRVPNAIRANFLSSPPSHRGLTPATLLNVGVISPRKRQVELLALARNLFEKGLPVKWQFIGSTPASDTYSRKFLQEIRRAEADGFAKYLGVKSADDLMQHMDMAGGLIHFPLEEAFGLVVAEGLARNLKFFGANLGGIRDITDKVDGVELFEPDDWESLASSVQKWHLNGCPRTKGAAETMLLRYSPNAVARRHLEIYEAILSKFR